MAGYSGTPLAQKLGMKSGTTVVLINAPAKLPEITWQRREWRGVHQSSRRKPEFHSFLHNASRRTGKTTAPRSDENRRLGNALGFVGEEIIRRGQCYHGRCYSRGRIAPWVRRYKGLRRRSNLVGIEVDDSPPESKILK